MGELTRLNLSWTLLLFALLLGLFWGRSELLPVAADGGDMPLGALLNRFCAGYPVTAKTLAAVLLLLNGILLLRIVSRNMILTDRSYIPIIVYLLVAAGCSFGSTALGAVTVSLLAICSFDQMLGSFRRAVQYGKLFNAALLAGLTSLIWSHAVVYALLLPVSLILFKKGGREWIVAWVGFLLPWAICSYVYWGMGYPFGHVTDTLAENLTNLAAPGDFPEILRRPELPVFWGMCLTTVVLSLISFIRRSDTIRTRAYKSYIYFLWILLFSAAPFAFPGRSVQDLPMIAAPLAIIIPPYFIRYRGWIPGLIYFVLVGSIVFYNLAPALLP